MMLKRIMHLQSSPAPDPEPEGDTTMRFMMIVKADKNSEAGVLPDQKLLAEMGKFNEEMVKAGVMLAGEGLQASSKGARVSFSGGKRTITDGPFTEAKELIAGFWLIEVKSKEEFTSTLASPWRILAGANRLHRCYNKSSSPRFSLWTEYIVSN
jgi:hypothetical protein